MVLFPQAKSELRTVEDKLTSARLAGPNAFNALSEEQLVELGRERDRLKVGHSSKLKLSLCALMGHCMLIHQLSCD